MAMDRGSCVDAIADRVEELPLSLQRSTAEWLFRRGASDFNLSSPEALDSRLRGMTIRRVVQTIAHE